ncbi:hypothetical protein ACIQNG_25415 [Streptomyces sp. NPDC091377]|uniref:hypothetical protein n=1 Tax=Streptomyces sp. NPDC091377 TaxID=3365995 RepID=UPI00380F3F4D
MADEWQGVQEELEHDPLETARTHVRAVLHHTRMLTPSSDRIPWPATYTTSVSVASLAARWTTSSTSSQSAGLHTVTLTAGRSGKFWYSSAPISTTRVSSGSGSPITDSLKPT